MAGLNDLLREYEARHFPVSQRLDLHGEGPLAARRRALQWIQSFAHEQPGAELLLIVERSRGAGRRTSAVRQSVQKLLDELTGGLIDWWQPFGPGSISVRVALTPRMVPLPVRKTVDPKDEGRTAETAGAAHLTPDADIPLELLPVARQAAELRRHREGLSVGLLEVVLRRIWIEAQATAMSERIGFEVALSRILEEEVATAYEED